MSQPAGPTEEQTQTGRSEAPAVEVSLPADVFLLFWSRRRGVGMMVLAAGVIGVAAALLWRPKYLATASFIPEQTSASRLSSGLGSLAGELGVSLASDPQQSGRFYAEVLSSRRVIEQVLRGYYRSAGTSTHPDSATLLDQMEIRGRDSLDRIQKGVKKLRAAISVDADLRTNIVTLTVAAPDRYLAADVANRFVQTVNEFNTKARQSQAGRRRRFVEQQADSAERELRTAEDRLKRFYEQNRSWAQSPQLQYRLGQLQRQVDIEKEVYLTLRRNLETARIDEVNDVPLISVIDVAAPTRDRTPRRSLIFLVSLVLGSAAGVVYAYASWYWDTIRGKSRTSDVT